MRKNLFFIGFISLIVLVFIWIFYPCELKFGYTFFDDFYVSNKYLCYEKRALEGDYESCLHTIKPDECLYGLSIENKELICDQVSVDEVSNRCIKLLFDYYRPIKDIFQFKGIERIKREEKFNLQEGDKFPHSEFDEVSNVEVKEGRLKQPGYVSGPTDLYINRWEEFSCSEDDGDYKIISGIGANQEGRGYIIIKSCDYTPDGIIVELIHIE